MTTHLWYGRQPTGYEADAIARQRRELDAASITAHLFANFEVGGHELDLLVVKSGGIFLVELKKVGGPVVGAVNGEWRVLNGRGAYPLPGGCGENPYQQMRTQYRVLSEWLERRKRDFLSTEKANVTRFRPLNYRDRTVPRVQIRSLLAFYPELPRGSQLDIEWPIEPVSFAELSTTLRQPTKRVNLTDAEIVALAQSLHLTRWEETSVSPPPSLRENFPVQRWLPPREFSVHNAWQRLLLSIVAFLADYFDKRHQNLLAQYQSHALRLSHPMLGLTTPLQPQPSPVSGPPTP